jgi:beta-mannosidase
MAEVFGEWRRAGSVSRGGFVLWASDQEPGSGWGLLDHQGGPKRALRGLQAVWAPVAIWTVDEGLGGIDVHVANDTARPLPGVLRVELVRVADESTVVDQAERVVCIGPREVARFGVEAVLGHFADASYAYRFGPRMHDAVVAQFIDEDGGAIQTRRELT